MSDKRKIFAFNKKLSNPFTIVVLCFACDIFIFLGFNFLLNIIKSLKFIIEDSGDIGSFINMQTVFSFDFTNFGWVYVLFIVLLLFGNGMIIYKVRTNFKDYNTGQKGSERWTTLKELEEQYRTVPEKDETYAGKGSVIISRMKDKIFIDDSPVNNLIIGTTRSGKGELFVFPTIDIYSRAEQQPSLIVTDPKLELAAASFETLQKRGYEVHVLNLVDMMNSMGYNPLQLIVDSYRQENYSEAELLCKTLAFSIFNPKASIGGNDKFFNANAAAALSAIILAQIEDCLKEGTAEKITMHSIVNTFTTLAGIWIDDKTTELDLYFRNRPQFDRAKMKYASINVAGDRTKASIFSSMLTELEVFTYENVARMTAESTFRLKDVGFGKKPIAIFIGIPDYDSSVHFLASMFIRQLYFVLAKGATFETGGKCKREVVFMLDEFGNLPTIENMANIITVCLGRNIRFNLVVQSLQQIKRLYGEDDATIIGNCGNKIYIQSGEPSTAEEFSKMLGSETITNVNRSGKKLSLDKNFTEMYEEKPLLNAAQLQGLELGQCVVKRIMKRSDLKGNKIKPTPIFNKDKASLKFRSSYLLDAFPDNRLISDLPIESRAHIDYEQRTFDVFQYLKDKECNKQKDMPLLQTKFSVMANSFSKLLHVPEEVLNMMTVEELKDKIQEMYDLNYLDVRQKKQLFNFVKKL